MTSIRHKDDLREAAASPDDAYLDAARDAILAVGWSRTTLTDIARRAGVSRMTLYRRWPDISTLLADLMTREWARVVAVAATDPSADGSKDPLTPLVHTVTATVHALRVDPLLRRIAELDPELLLPYLLDRRGRSQELVVTTLAALLEEGQRAGAVRAGDPVGLARTVVLACHGFVLSAHTMLDDPPASPLADVTALDRELAEMVRRYLHP